MIARNTSFTYKGKAVDAKQIGHDLGVRYLLAGSVRKAGDRVRITAQLIDATTGSHIWSDRYDGGVEDIFDLQDRITENIVGAIQPSLLLAEIERTKRKRPESLDAYECMLRAYPYIWAFDPSANATALDHLQRAIEIEPDYPPALALAAWCQAAKSSTTGRRRSTRPRPKGCGLPNWPETQTTAIRWCSRPWAPRIP